MKLIKVIAFILFVPMILSIVSNAVFRTSNNRPSFVMQALQFANQIQSAKDQQPKTAPQTPPETPATT